MKRIGWDAKKARRSKHYRKKLFIWFIIVLEQSSVYVVKDLRAHNKPKKKLSGLLVRFSDGTYEIYLKSHVRGDDPMLFVLVHELLHALFFDLNEEQIYEAEEILFARFSRTQKETLAEYIPKQCVRRQLRLDDEGNLYYT